MKKQNKKIFIKKDNKLTENDKFSNFVIFQTEKGKISALEANLKAEGEVRKK